MKKYFQYHVDDFVWDDSFRQWVLSPTRENDAWWQQWLAEHPEKAVIIQQARSMVQGLQLREPDLSDEEIRYTIQRTISRIKKNQGQERPHQQPEQRVIPLHRQSRTRPAWLRVAAALVLMLGVSFITWKMWFSAPINQSRQTVSYPELVEHKALAEVINHSAKPMPVKLGDGSLIILKAGSRISYGAAFNGSTREMYLSGEGFFEVAKNPDKPFLIYANGLVTKVLGTSFIIRAYPTDRDVTVEVKTGRVAVFAQADPSVKEKVRSRELDGMLLTPNQKIVFLRDESRFSKSLVDAPQLVSEPNATHRFAFEDTPVPAVFDALEQAYEVDIVYDESLLANCPLTATLTDQPLFEKLDIICRVIEARYDVIDGQIIIYSRGCKS